MGQQNITLQRKRDDGKIDTTNNPMHNDGNFRQLLKYRADGGDAVLSEQLTNSKSNATYISKTTQNQLIEACGKEIQDVILNRIRNAKYYSVCFDETTDISTVSQLSLVFTYKHEKKRYEDFFEFIDVHESIWVEREGGMEPKITGKSLGQLVLQKLKENKMNLSNCVGIGTDGCSVMISEKVGAVKEIQSEATNAVRCPCFNQVISFFGFSSKRRTVITSICGGKIKKFCETRWTERIESTC